MNLIFNAIRKIYQSNHFIGKERLKTFLLKLYRSGISHANELTCTAYDGRRFRINLYDRTYDKLYFTGYFEKNETNFVEAIIKKGDIILDIGANFGWYTTLCSKIAGNDGWVHAFEPVPSTIAELQFNLSLNGASDNVTINKFALGDELTTTHIFLFKGLPHSHASLSDLGRNDGCSIEIDVFTLDSYAEKHLFGKKISFVKMDVEGAEMKVLDGGRKFFENQHDMWMLFEINQETSDAFDYDSAALIQKLKALGFSKFIRCDDTGRPELIYDYNRLMHGDNVFCYKQ